MKQIISTLFVTLVVLSGCTGTTKTIENKNVGIKEKVKKESVKAEDSASSNQNIENPTSLKKKAQSVINVIAQKDMKALSAYVHPEKGLLYSPYVYVGKDAMVFQLNEVKHLLEKDEVYEWGSLDGSGKPIKLTPREYHERYVFKKSFENPDQILVDAMKQRGNTRNNIKDVFPNSRVVEYYHAGTKENEGMDWQSMNLVFTQDKNGVWKLTALVRDCWTI